MKKINVTFDANESYYLLYEMVLSIELFLRILLLSTIWAFEFIFRSKRLKIHIPHGHGSCSKLTFWIFISEKIRNGEDGDKLKLFSKVVGFDFLKELNSITYFSNGAKDNGVVLFKHNANIERLVAIIKLDKSHRSTTYGQETIHGVGSRKDRTYICFPNQGLAICTKRSLTHQALDVFWGKGFYEIFTNMFTGCSEHGSAPFAHWVWGFNRP